MAKRWRTFRAVVQLPLRVDDDYREKDFTAAIGQLLSDVGVEMQSTRILGLLPDDIGRVRVGIYSRVVGKLEDLRAKKT